MWERVGVIIFSSVRFLTIKTTKPKFCKIQKIKPKPVQTDRFRIDSDRLFYIKNWNPTDRFQFGFGAVRLFYIKNQKLYCFLGVFLDFLMGLVSVQFSFFRFGFFIFQFGSVFRFQAYETEPNIFLNILISFFSWFGFFGFFFFSQFNRFFGFFTHP
jgi:hypothetical protein